MTVMVIINIHGHAAVMMYVHEHVHLRKFEGTENEFEYEQLKSIYINSRV